jgi:hypothetical protein
MATDAQLAPGDDLEPLTERIRVAAAAGKPLDLLCPDVPLVLIDADKMRAWGEDRTIQARELTRLLLHPGRRIHASGVHLRGVKIDGQFDLKAAKLPWPLRLEDCYFDDKFLVNFDYAEVSLLALIRCRLAGLSGNSLTAAKGLDLTGSVLSRALTLPDAAITGRFCGTDAQLKGVAGDRRSAATRQGYALDADGMKVSGDVVLDRGFTADGGIWLNRADIAGRLDCTGATLTAASASASALAKDADGRGDHGDCAMYADGLKVGDNVLLNRCTAQGGGIRLSTATIAGELICKGTHLNGADRKGNALRANQLKTSGNVSIGSDDDHGFTAAGGKLSLTNATIGGELRFRPSLLCAGKDKVSLDATAARIAQKLHWEPEQQIDGRVILRDVTVGRLEDTWAATPGDTDPQHRGYWPSDGSLDLNGLSYGSIASCAEGQHDGARARLEWIQSQYGRTAATLWSPPNRNSNFATQPYQQLANFYLQAGLDADARRIAIARRRDFRRYGKLSRPGKFGNWLLDVTIRYGYRTWRATIVLAVLYLLVVVFFFSASHHDAVIPVQPTSVSGTQTAPSATTCTGQYPCFNPWGYAIDTVIPIINVHQTDFWGPNREAASPWGWSAVWVIYLGTGVGWLFVTLAVAGYTGLARNTAAP